MPMDYDKEKYKLWNWKHPGMLHWIINPGLVISELLLGQRVPKIMLVERDKNKGLLEKTWVSCPHCHTLHSGLKWSFSNKTAFKNWFGLYCDNCGEIIPCYTNLASYLVLAVTFPFWFPFKKALKRRWLNKQPERYSNIDDKTVSNPFDKRGWIHQGLAFALIMFLLMTFLYPLITGDQITGKSILVGIVVWPLGGLLYGQIMKRLTTKKINQKV